MSGIAFAAGDQAERRVDRMLSALVQVPAETHVEAPNSNLAMGGIWHAATAGSRRPLWFGGRYLVAVDGEFYGADKSDPYRPFAEMADGDRFDRIATLNGSFAFAIWDAQSRTIILGADRLSTRPLYYWQDAGALGVASRLHGLLADDRSPRRLSRTAVVELLAHLRTFGRRTMFADISGLVAGEVVRLTLDGSVSRQQPARPQFLGSRRNRQDYRCDLADALRAAVAKRTDDEARPVLLLSGGLDSRLVAASASSIGRSLPCYSVAAWRNREITIAEKVARAAGQRFEFRALSADDVSAAFDMSIALTDCAHQPCLSLPPAYASLRADGYHAVLNGHLLDIFFRGTYLPKAKLKVGRSGATLPRLVPPADAAPETISATHHIRSEWNAAQASLAVDLADALPTIAAAGVGAALATMDFSDPADAYHVFVLHALSRHASHGDFLAATPFMEMRTPALDRDLLDLFFTLPVDWKARGLEVRSVARSISRAPFRIIDSNTGAPMGWPYPLQLSLLMARAAVGRLHGFRDGSRLSDPKLTQGSWLNWPEFLRSCDGMRIRLQALCTSSPLFDAGLLRQPELQRVVDAHLTQRAVATKFLMMLLGLDSWIRRVGFTAVAD